MINFKIEDINHRVSDVEVPEDISLSLMEVLKGLKYPIPAICGGIGICATCHVIVSQGFDQLPEPSEEELDVLDTLTGTTYCSRLACQIRISQNIKDCVFYLQSLKTVCC